MSFFEERSAEYIHLVDGLSGRTPEAIQATIDAVNREGGGVIAVASQSVLLMNDGADGAGLSRCDGEFLFGMTNTDKTSPDMPYDAVVYAEANDMTSKGAFSVVKMASWMRRSVEDDRFMQGINLEKLLADNSLDDVDVIGEEGQLDEVWGIPVERLTLITDFYGLNGYRYGQMKDLLELAQLDLPDELIHELTVRAEEWHDDELRASGLL